ncbi:DUF4251 domain-containing protein [uncultured Eudoraea sp.]|uniref:DUF4251 domain-containing protein n=1 Tax=uncultured Eudoraea sp. TaxID=1035614 RepID=UPI002615ABF6|nr:DUF4251 domain-containing protein [uncultured Eudoraea sp.]
MKNTLFKILVLLLVTGSLTAQSKNEKQQKKEAGKNTAFEAIKNLVDSGSYIFDATRATAIGAGEVSLATNINRFIVKDGELNMDLPYFGVVRGAGGYNKNPGIAYKGIPDKYEVEHIDNKRRTVIRIGVRSGTERHDLKLTVGYAGQTTINVISSARNSINYYGYLKPLKAEISN